MTCLKFISTEQKQGRDFSEGKVGKLVSIKQAIQVDISKQSNDKHSCYFSILMEEGIEYIEGNSWVLEVKQKHEFLA